jgi:hypothetical protein
MDIYHIWCDLKPGVKDLEFTDAVNVYLGSLKSQNLVEGFRVTRRKLGLSPAHLQEFHIMIDVIDLAQLDKAFGKVAARAGEIEMTHFGVNSLACNLSFALYRDFPDDFRVKGEEKF